LKKEGWDQFPTFGTNPAQVQIYFRPIFSIKVRNRLLHSFFEAESQDSRREPLDAVDQKAQNITRQLVLAMAKRIPLLTD